MANPFVRATKAKAKLRLALIGPSGSGKTWTALMLSQRLAERMGGRVAVVDTERGSASLYSDRFDFDVLELQSFSPQGYIDAIHAAESAGYAVIVLDSISHAWAGAGGVLEFVDNTAKRQQSGNSFSAWREGSKLQNTFVDAMLSSSAHIIATMRSKQDWVQEKDSSGRTQIRKVGMQPVQRDGLDYEFTITGDLDNEHALIIGKSRMEGLADRVIPKPGVALADEIATWLEAGVDAPARAPSTNGHAPMTQAQAVAPAAQPTPEDIARDRFKIVAKERGLSAKAICSALSIPIDPDAGPAEAIDHAAKLLGWDDLRKALEDGTVISTGETAAEQASLGLDAPQQRAASARGA